MRNAIKVIMLFAMFAVDIKTTGAQILVHTRPKRPAVVLARPPKPSPHSVWVDEEWQSKGHGYVWHGDRWSRPPRADAIYVPGHWVSHPNGSVWVKGFWRL